MAGFPSENVPADQTQTTVGGSITLSAALSFSGYNWLGWNTSASGGVGTRYAAGSSYTPTSNITMYGEWSEVAVEYSKITDLSKAEKVIITTSSSGTNYYLPATENTSTAPSAPTCTITNNKLTSVGASHLFDVSIDNGKYIFTNSGGKYLYNISNNNGVRVGSTSDSWTVTATTNGFKMFDTNNSRYLGVWTAATNGPDWRSYTASDADNYAGTGETINFYGIEKDLGTLTSIALSGEYPTTFKQGDPFSHEGMVVTATYSKGSMVVTGLASWSGYNMSNPGVQTVTVSYTDGVTRTATYDITITESIQLASSDVALHIGDSDYTPIVKISGTSTEVSGCTFTSGNTSAVTIVNGKLHVAGAGKATITAAHADGDGKTYTSATFTAYVSETIQSVVTSCVAITDNTGTISGTHYIQGTVTGVYGTSFMIQEGNYAMYIYTSTNYSISLNDVVRVTGTFGRYNKWIESRSVSSVEKLTFATPELISPLVVSDPATLTDSDQNRLVSFTGLAYNSGTYTVGTNSSIEFLDSNSNTIVYRTEKNIDDTTEGAIKTKIDAIIADKDNLVVDLIGAHYTVFLSGEDVQKQFKITNADVITYRARTATDEDIVNGFVNDKLHWNDYETTHTAGVDGAHECLGADGYYIKAKNAFQLLTENQQNLFRHLGTYASGADTYAAPRQRFEDWASAYGDLTPYSAEVTPRNGRFVALNNNESSDAVAVIVIISIASLTAIGGYFFLRKRREQN